LFSYKHLAVESNVEHEVIQIVLLNNFVVYSMFMKKIVVLFFLLISNYEFAQVAAFDKMEMWFAQGHYKMVYRKANYLLDIPDYDFSLLPKYYKSISLLQLCQNENWLKRHSSAIEDAKLLFHEVKKSSDGRLILIAHQDELRFLKNDLIAHAEMLKASNDQAGFDLFYGVTVELFGVISNNVESDNQTVAIPEISNFVLSEQRKALVDYASKYIGVPYVWAGMDEKGFDCSGFSTYVFKEFKIDLPRRAADQQKSSEKLKEKNVQAGDLIFFSNGGAVSHVGILISEKGKPLVMIHASSSQGIVITEIDSSEYWKKRIHSFGSFLN
jgi:peptidoglycan DL-endopeptidase CwlO